MARGGKKTGYTFSLGLSPKSVSCYFFPLAGGGLFLGQGPDDRIRGRGWNVGGERPDDDKGNLVFGEKLMVVQVFHVWFFCVLPVLSAVRPELRKPSSNIAGQSRKETANGEMCFSV